MFVCVIYLFAFQHFLQVGDDSLVKVFNRDIMPSGKVTSLYVEVVNNVDGRIGKAVCHFLYVVDQVMVLSFLACRIPGVIDDAGILVAVGRERIQQMFRRKLRP